MNEIDTLIEISKTTSNKEKIQLLKDNETKNLKELLVYAYDLFKVFKIKHLKFDKITKRGYDPLLHNEFVQVLDKLTTININDKIRQEVKEFLEKCPLPQQEIYYKILTKDLTIGITAKSVNKAFPNLIKEFKIMKASAYTNQDLNKEFIVQTKYDGYRCLIIKDKRNITAYSSSGKAIPLKTIEKELYRINESFVLDGELVANSRTKTSTICNRLIKGNLNVDDSNLIYHTFDLLTLEEFYAGNFKEPCKNRLQNLKELGQQYNFKNIKIAPFQITTNEKEVFNLYAKAREKGEEGLMLKDPACVYELKRSKGWLKLKAINSCTLRIVDFIEHTKKPNTLGAITCVSGDNIIKVNVGSGFTDEERKDIWNNKNKLLNKCVEIIYNELQYTTDNKPFLFLPRFKELRLEKKEADNFEKIEKEYQ